MIAAVFMVAPSGTGTTTNIGGFEIGGPTLDYRSVVAGLGIGLFIAVFAQISWSEVARRSGVLDRQPGTPPVARRLGGGVRRRALLLLIPR